MNFLSYATGYLTCFYLDSLFFKNYFVGGIPWEKHYLSLFFYLMPPFLLLTLIVYMRIISRKKVRLPIVLSQYRKTAFLAAISKATTVLSLK